MTESEIKNAELALLITLNKSVRFLKPGKLKGLLDKLSEEAEKEADKLEKPTKAGLFFIGKALDKFKKLTGWGKAEKHLLTYVNSILLIIERRGYQKLNNILVDIVEYKERYESMPNACFWVAEVVEEKWRESFYGGKANV